MHRLALQIRYVSKSRVLGHFIYPLYPLLSHVMLPSEGSRMDDPNQNTHPQQRHRSDCDDVKTSVLLDFSLTVKAATLIFISGRGSAISSAKEGESGSIYNLVKN